MAIGISTQAGMFRGGGGYDADAQAWIDAVETADGEALEVGVTDAMNQMVLDYKAASLWTTINSKVVLMAARTVAGTLVNIKDPTEAWTNSGFVAGDYNRTTGLKGDGSSYLDSGVAGTEVAQNDHHGCVQIHTKEPSNVRYYLGVGSGTDNGAFGFRRRNNSEFSFFSKTNTRVDDPPHTEGFAGFTRSSSTQFTSRCAGADSINSSNSEAESANASDNIHGFCSITGSTTTPTVARIQSISFGSATTLSTCETIMDDFVTAITALSL